MNARARITKRFSPTLTIAATILKNFRKIEGGRVCVCRRFSETSPATLFSVGSTDGTDRAVCVVCVYRNKISACLDEEKI